MDAHLLSEVLGLIGIRDYRRSGDYYMVRCFFPWRHKAGKDESPSMSISIDPVGMSWVKCWGCNYNKPLKRAVRDLAMQIPASGLTAVADWVEKNDGEEISGPRPIEQEIVQDYTAKAKALVGKRMPKEALDLLAEKGVTDTGIIEENLLWHPRLKGIVFPFLLRRRGKTLVIGGSIRQLEPRATTPKYWTLWKFKAKYHLYGEWRAHEWSGQPVLFVEGFFDVLHAWQEGVPCLGLVGKVFSPEKGKYLTDCGIRSGALVLDPDVYETEEGPKIVQNSLEAMSSVGLVARDVRAPVDPKYLSRGQLISLLEEGAHGQAESRTTDPDPDRTRTRRRFRRRDEPR